MSDQIEAAGALVTAGMVADTVDQRAPGHGAHGSNCPNCGSMLTGPFCGQCGQRAHLHRTVGAVFHEFLHGITHFDGKAWTTLPMLLFRPGKLIRSYIEGQRARYIAPVPLFLLVVFLMFFVLSFASFNERLPDVNLKTAEASTGQQPPADAFAEIDRDIAAAKAAGDARKLTELAAGRRLITLVGAANADASITDRLADEIAAANARGEMNIDSGSKWFDSKIKKTLKNPKLALYKLQSKAYKLSFLLVPLSLPWLWLAFFWRRGIGMYDHAIFTLYSISFMSLLFIAGSLALTANITSGLFWSLVLLAPAVHLFAALRGAYAIGPFSAGWRTAYLMVAGTLSLTCYLVILVVLGVLD